MIEQSFKSNSDSETKRIANFIELNYPEIFFTIEKTVFGFCITVKFNSEKEKNSFFNAFSSNLNIKKDGNYLK